MPNALCRVAIHCELPGADEPATVDLSLPSSMTVGQLIPAIADAVGAGTGPRRWSLSRVGGPALDESMSLSQQDIRDGDLLLLCAAAVPKPRPRDPSLIGALAEAIPDPQHPALRPVGCLGAVLVGAMTLVAADGVGRLATAAALTVAVTCAALAARRVRCGPHSVVALDMCAVLQAAVLGFLVVPGGPAAANVFLAAVASASVGAVLLRVTDGSTVILIAVVAATATVGVISGVGVIWPMSTAALGAVVATAALGGLTASPRLSIALAGLTPALPGDDDEPDGNVAGRVLRGHRTLTGLVAGFSAAAGLGTMVVGVGAGPAVTPAAVAFTAAVGVALMLRARSYASGPCRIALAVAGFAATTALFVLIVAWSPESAHWAAGIAVSAGLAALTPRMATLAAGHRATRVLDAVEYLALASVVPLACWLAGLFDLARGLNLP
ncbi:type VII secretion integral membrane protein EccD [Mycobacterium sp. 852013-50091_SCH5140682]|uniref:type VII secretion integral membrane protein EccD n=1 Tax=Mycobacterium sp. 852013-50091_SCH5140682 TaxID=1834109 RepID=UPI0007EBB17F|nr:type VII secretion integral membrane protein EccD [Mycobacterium sp. 852013-50091_SCH5140682]OBC08056.1 type VII secretion integral membrane protein EccD [Mycobacterium sp. 852013-50091_SCH5140682]